MDSFEAIYQEYFPQVYKYLLAQCRDPHLAEELTQQAFFKAMGSLHKFDGRCRLYVWLCQIAKNTWLHHLEKEKRRASLPEDLPGPGLEESFADKDTAARLHVLLHDLQEPYKEVFSLRVFGQLPFAQIGALFGKSDSWARVVYYRAKTELRRGLNETDL